MWHKKLAGVVLSRSCISHLINHNSGEHPSFLCIQRPDISITAIMSTAAPIVAFKKGPRRPVTSSRKRSASPPSSSTPLPNDPSSSSSSSVIRPTKKSLANPLIQGTKRRRDPNELGGTEGEGGLDELDYKADDAGLTKGDVYATRSTDYDLESLEKNEKRVKLNEVSVVDSLSTSALNLDSMYTGGGAVCVLTGQDGEIDDGLYRGQANYLQPITKRTDVLDKKMKSGPIRATSNIRTITLIDYQPDVCKDYKETGFCGYGDSCKFLHDRGDYLAGWQLDKLDPDSGKPVVEEEDELEEVPFACLICRKPFTDPVVTKCGHYFCMQ